MTVKKKEIGLAVIGCGTMGGGIAMNFANAGIAVKILEVKEEALEKGEEKGEPFPERVWAEWKSVPAGFDTR